jgi:hypothetical protein
MKQIFLSLIVVGAILSSCNQANKSETKEAVKVDIVKTESTETYSNFSDASYIDWRATHLGGVQPRYGKIFIKETQFSVTDGVITNGMAIIDMKSLSVESFPEGAEEKGKLEGHLLSGDFFKVDEFPTSKFELTSIESNDGEMNSKVTGNLSILGISKNISFFANVNISKNDISVVSETFSIDRTDWGLTYNVEGTEGVPVDYLISNDIEFKLNVNLTK